MIAIATLLEFSANSKTERTWQRLERECGLSGIKIAPMPHLSWQVAEDYDLEKINSVLKDVAEKIPPFFVQGIGLGIFTKEIPVLYYALMKTKALIEIHQRLWEGVSECADGLQQVYSPDTWIPHITLAYKDVIPDKLACAVMDLAFQPLHLEIVVDHFAAIYLDGTDFGMKFNVAFNGRT